MAGCLFPSLSISYWFKCDSCNLHGFYNLGFLESIFFLFRSVFTQTSRFDWRAYDEAFLYTSSLVQLIIAKTGCILQKLLNILSLIYLQYYEHFDFNCSSNLTNRHYLSYFSRLDNIKKECRNLLVRYINTPYLGSGWVCFMTLDCLTVRWFLHYVQLPNLTTNSRSFSYLWTKMTGWGRIFRISCCSFTFSSPEDMSTWTIEFKFVYI